MPGALCDDGANSMEHCNTSSRYNSGSARSRARSARYALTYTRPPRLGSKSAVIELSEECAVNFAELLIVPLELIEPLRVHKGVR